MSEMLLLARAYEFAARMHSGQTRKGLAAEPYINHPCEVAALLAQACGGTDTVLIAGGVLHDIVEDTAATQDDLVSQFGDEIAALVMEVTDDRSLPKAERKRLQIGHAATASPRAKMLKLADKTCNLRGLVVSPPADWPHARREAYIDWCELVVVGCRGHNVWLEETYDAALLEARAALAEELRAQNVGPA